MRPTAHALTAATHRRPPALEEVVLVAHADEQILARQRHRESAARTYARWLDIVPVRAEGSTVIAADGRRYLDCLSGAGTLALGHNHPEVLAAMRATLDSLAPLHILDVATPEKDRFVSELFGTLPPDFLARDPLIQFCGPTGADAVEAAIKLCQTATGRRGVACFTGAYHGMTLAALAASGAVDPRRDVGGTDAAITRLPYPYPLRCPFGLGDENGAVAAEYARRLFADPSGGVVPPALLLLEPVQGEGGVIPAPAPWLRSIAAIAREHEIPLVVDEVQTGVGRTGSFWAHTQAGVVPDVIVCSKAIGGGLPLSAVIYARELDAWQPGAHAGTFRGNVLAMVAGAATLGIVTRDGLVARSESLGRCIAACLRRELEGCSAVAQIRGRGLMLGVELVDPTAPRDHLGTGPAAPELAQAVRGHCLARGMIVELGGRHGSVMRLLPSLIVTDAEANRIVETLVESIAVAVREFGWDEG